MKIVMIDDSLEDRALCRVLLEEAYGPGLLFFEAPDAAAGLKACREATPDCVLLDYNLPDMTGLEFLAQLRLETPVYQPALAVVMLTALGSDQMALEAMRFGAQDYLLKSRLSVATLRMAIHRATQKVDLIRELRAEHARLARSLQEKEILIKEVHHRVKNNLQVIASLLRLQEKAANDQNAGAVLQECQRRVEAMALIHDQLYESGDLREINVARQANLLMTNLFHSFGVDPSRISSAVLVCPRADGGPLALGVDQAIPAGLILNEVISNALKHAFPESRKGQIRVEASIQESQVTLAVVDNGVGLPPDFSNRATKSLGLHIVDILAKQLRGTTELKTDSGTVFRLSFPAMQEHAIREIV